MSSSGARAAGKSDKAAAADSLAQNPAQEEAASTQEEDPADTSFVPGIEPETVPDSEPAERRGETAAEKADDPEPREWSYDTPESKGMRSEALSALHTT